MELIKKYYRNVIVLLLGVLLLSIGGALFLTANIGSDSLMVFNQGISVVLKTKVGLAIMISNIIALFIIFFINKKTLGLGSLAIIFLLGPTIQIIKDANIFKTPNTLILQILMVLIGIVIGGLGLALYMYADLGLSPFEGIIVTISNKTKVRFGIIKIIFDAIYFTTGALLGGVFGIGSIMTVFLYGPTIDMFMKLLKKTNIIKKRP
ncbi:MAG TPA: hypothetical protein PKO43_03695 [Bacilli bacterium]|nr:hypothetical protein [Bacilli bacterium]HQA19636.1 hypothetical protein [Bacilli bacterium]HQD92663.1 hypothetical protein [Bacilli bacterium]